MKRRGRGATGPCTKFFIAASLVVTTLAALLSLNEMIVPPDSSAAPAAPDSSAAPAASPGSATGARALSSAAGAAPAACAAAQIGLGTSFFPQDGMDLRATTVGEAGWQDEMRALTAAAVDAALAAGVRFFDLSAGYANTDATLAALAAALASGRVASRDELCVCVKLKPEGDVAADARALLRDRGALAFFDVALAYHPPRDGDVARLWRALESLVDDGTARALGLSNFYRPADVDAALAAARAPATRAALAQFEVHPYQQNAAVAAHCAARGVRVVAHSPLGAPNKVRFLARAKGDERVRDAYTVLEDAAVARVAAARGATAAAVVLRWHLDAGRTPIPKSYDAAHIAENAAAARLAPLAPDERAAIDALHKAEEISVVRFFHQGSRLLPQRRRRRESPAR